MFVLLILLVVAAVGYGFIHFLIKSLNPGADYDARVWASLFFAVLVFVFFGFMYLVSSSF